MATESYGTNFREVCHGAGRVSNRSAAKGELHGETIQKELAARGISIRATHPTFSKKHYAVMHFFR